MSSLLNNCQLVKKGLTCIFDNLSSIMSLLQRKKAEISLLSAANGRFKMILPPYLSCRKKNFSDTVNES